MTIFAGLLSICRESQLDREVRGRVFSCRPPGPGIPGEAVWEIAKTLSTRAPMAFLRGTGTALVRPCQGSAAEMPVIPAIVLITAGPAMVAALTPELSATQRP